MVIQNVLIKIDAIISQLSSPLSSSESTDGWTAESKTAARKFFEGLGQKLQSGEPLPPLGISRALDHWGVTSGGILEMAAQISNQLREYRGPHT
jgi:hypothetical protein